MGKGEHSNLVLLNNTRRSDNILGIKLDPSLSGRDMSLFQDILENAREDLAMRMQIVGIVREFIENNRRGCRQDGISWSKVRKAILEDRDNIRIKLEIILKENNDESLCALVRVLRAACEDKKDK